MTISFWINEPTILFNKEYIFELWPTIDMCYEQKLNAITRLVILITILGYILTMSKRVLLVGVVTIIVIFVLFKMRKEKITKEMVNEGFKVQSRENNERTESSYVNPVTLESVLKSEFKEGNKKNPFSNVLLTQIEDDPERKSAPPSFNVDVDEDITKNVKRTVQMMNPGIKNTNKQLFGDLWQEFELDQSNRVFYSTPNTRVQPGDQASFGQYLYGTMYSAKESTPEGAFARVQDNWRWQMI
jgi:hypothetical protein